MSIGIPHTISKDWRELVAQDQANQRKIQLKNIERDTREMGPIWKQQQIATYPNLLDTTPDVPLEKVISSENSLANDADNNRAIAYRDLVSISSPTIAEYILDRLEPDEILFLIIHFKGIVYSMRKKTSRMDKDYFIDIIKTDAQNQPINLAPADLSEAGARKLDVAYLRGRENEDRLLEQDRKFRQGVEAQNRQAEEYSRREQIRRERQAERERARQEEGEDIPQHNIFDDIEQDIQEQRVFGLARQRKQEIDDAVRANAQDAPPVRLGAVLEANPSSPPRISPADKIGKESKSTGKKQRSRAKKNLESELLQAEPAGGNRKGAGGGGKKVQGFGVIYGRGSNMRASSIKKRFYFEKYYVELDKLVSNILSVKYARTDAYMPTLKVQVISNKVKELIQDVMRDDYDERIFKLLPEEDKRVFKRFVKALHLNLPIHDDLDERFQKEYEILLGEFNSGNTSAEVKKALKKYVVEGLNEGKLSRHQAYFLLYQLSL
jgi:hypothetical protein